MHFALCVLRKQRLVREDVSNDEHRHMYYIHSDGH